MELRDLKYFEVIATTGHLGRAAERLGRTQPALSKCVRRIEVEIGTRVLIKAGRGVQLTSAGRVLLDRARSLRMTVEENLREMADLAKGAIGLVRVGTGATTADHLLPQVCQRLLGQHPSIKLDISIGMNDVLRAQLSDGKIDVVVGPLTKGDEDSYITEKLSDDSVVVAAAKDHPLTCGPVGLADLVAHGWVLAARSVVTRQWIDAAFASRGLPEPRVVIQTNSISLSTQIIARTHLLTFVSRRSLASGRAGELLAEIRLEETTMQREVGVVRARSAYTPPAVERLIAILKDEASDALGTAPSSD